MLRFAISTRCTSEPEFLESTLAGQSIRRLMPLVPVQASVAYGATDGLPAVYNAIIDRADAQDTLVFMHDDVRIDDWHVHARVEEALKVFDVIGVAGNESRQPFQINWWGMYREVEGEPQFVDCGTPRGAISYADGHVQFWSDEPAEVKSLDGVFIAVRKATLQACGIRFDPRFRYHLYDMDFCRQCEDAGLRMGVWPIALCHQSRGRLDGPWHEAAMAYLKKWGS